MMAADYRHIDGLENRLGRHYSRFPPFSPTPALAGQSLAPRKLRDAGSNRRSRANLLVALLLWRCRKRFLPSLSAGLILAVTLVVFFVWTYPANQATANWTAVPADWQALRSQWEFSHTAHAV
jgi:hypothetical protein